MFVFGIGQKTERPGLAGLYTSHGRDCHIGISDNFASKMLSYLFCTNLHYKSNFTIKIVQRK